MLKLESGEIILDRYRILDLLGIGGMGSVYKVENTTSGNFYALKFLNKQQENDAAFKRFELEAKAANKLDHPNLVKVHETGLLPDGQPFYVMDLVEGKTLAELLVDGTLPLETAVKIFIQVGFALSYAHSNGVIHRDIKPSNIMIQFADEGKENSQITEDRSRGMVVRLVDFGIAKLTGHDEFSAQTLTRTGEIFGSPLYMSPEQCLGIAVDQRTDLYSLGCVFFESLIGTPPFVGETALSTMLKHQTAAADTLKSASLGKEFPKEIEDIVAKLLSKEPADRFQSAQEFTSELVAFDCGQSSAISNQSQPKALTLPERRASQSIFSAQKIWLSVWFTGLAAAGIAIGYFLPHPIQENAPGKDLGAIQIQDDHSKTEEAEVLNKQLSDFANKPGFFSNDGPRVGERTFKFPPFKIGKLFDERGIELAAKGDVVIPNFRGILFTPSINFREHPSLMRKFRADDLFSLDLGIPTSLSAVEEYARNVDELVANMTALKSIKTLSLNNCKISQECLYNIEKLPNLEALTVAKSNVTGEMLMRTALPKRMSSLAFDDMEDASPVINEICKANKIVALSARHCNLKNQDIIKLKNCNTLSILDIGGNPEIDDTAIAALPVSITQLNLDGCNVTPETIRALKHLKRLAKISIKARKWSAEEMANFKKGLPKSTEIRTDVLKLSL